MYTFLVLFTSNDRTWAMYGVIIAPNLAIVLQAPTPMALSCVGYT